MREAMRRIAEEGADAAILIPSQESLKDFYAPFGFEDRSLPVVFEAPDDFDFGSGNRGTGSGYGLAPQQQRTAARTFALPASLIPQRTVPQKVRPDASRRPAVLSVLPNTRFRAIGSEDSTLSEKK